MALSTMSVGLLIVLIAAAPNWLAPAITAACLALVATFIVIRPPLTDSVSGS
jgi:hypothetical protein